jgi:hypothetical protein
MTCGLAYKKVRNDIAIINKKGERMNKRQAQQEGLHFTGVYTRLKEETKARIVQDRLKYPKSRIVMVIEPDSPLSRGSRGEGYSAYADSVYSAYQLLEENTKQCDQHGIVLELLKDQYEKKVEEQIVKHSIHLTKITEANVVLAEAGVNTNQWLEEQKRV